MAITFYTTMAAKRERESGQALVEFLMLLPVLLVFIWYMVHVSAAINKSIVGQKAARAQVFLWLANHSNGPQTSPAYESMDRSAFFIGVSKEVTAGTAATGSYAAPTEKLGIGFKPATKPDANDDPGTPAAGTLRQDVRVRTAFGICTARKVIKNSNQPTDYCSAEHEQ